MLLQLALPLHLAATAAAAAPPLPAPVAVTTQVPSGPSAATLTVGGPVIRAASLPAVVTSVASRTDTRAAPAPATTAPLAAAAAPDPGAAAADQGAPGQVAASRLADTRGGTDTVTNLLTLNGTVASNSAVNVVTGSNSIDAGSFANAAGLPMVVQNTGANVLIQNATIVNLQLH